MPGTANYSPSECLCKTKILNTICLKGWGKEREEAEDDLIHTSADICWPLATSSK